MIVKPIKGKTLEDIVNTLLEHLVPETKDKKFLNEISTRQIINATWRPNELPRNSSDANLLVPQSLYECKVNQVWRYPPHMTTDFLIRKSKNPIKINIHGGFGIPHFLLYGEYRPFGDSGRVQRRYLSSSAKIPVPKKFSKITFEGKQYDLSEEQAFRVTSAYPSFYEFETEATIEPGKQGEVLNEVYEISAITTLIKKYDHITGKEQTALSPTGEIVREIELADSEQRNEDSFPQTAFVDLTSGAVSFRLIIGIEDELGREQEYSRMRVRLINVQRYQTERPRDIDWRKLSLILPYIFITIKDTNIEIPPQQHEEALKQISEKGEEIKDRDVQAYNCVNCVLTRSIKNSKVLVCTMFGVFDTLREVPIPGPNLDLLISSKDNLMSDMDVISDSAKNQISKDDNISKTIMAVLRALKDSGQIAGPTLYKFQWEAIQHRIQYILEEKRGFTTVIKAPTGSGKTAIFMADAALHSLLTGERATMVFPTRILNEDMFKRLTKFIYALRKNLSENITGGIFIGQSDPLYYAVTYPKPGSPMIQYGSCPQCSKDRLVAQDVQGRIVGVCSVCNHSIDYMFSPIEASNYLPTITIATPDKLFYEATAAGSEKKSLRFFGGLFKKCGKCGYCIPIMGAQSQYTDCEICNSKVDLKNPESKPIGYYVFDEVHSLYGLTGTLLSIFIKTLTLMHNKIIGHNYLKFGLKNKPTFETGTATIANETDLLSAITRCRESAVFPFPSDQDYHKYFKLDSRSVRYRTLVLLPVAKAARTTSSNALLQIFADFHRNGWRRKLEESVPADANTELVKAYDFVLGYLYKKSDGYTLRRTLQDLAKQLLKESIKVEFLSGDSNTARVVNIFDKVQKKEIDILLANLVISLGIDIRNLNNMTMMGVAKTMTEHIQIAGRTGRGRAPGHVTIHLLPSNPRDMFVFEKFHLVMSDVKGYFDKMPIQSTNSYAAQIILPNIVKGLLGAQSYYTYCLTTGTAARYFSNVRKINAFVLDILNAMTEKDTEQHIKAEILRIIDREFSRYYLKRWSSLSGVHYLSGWFQNEKLILTSLREPIGRDVAISINDVNLYRLMEEQEKVPTAARFVTFEEEASDELYPDIEEE